MNKDPVRILCGNCNIRSAVVLMEGRYLCQECKLALEGKTSLLMEQVKNKS